MASICAACIVLHVFGLLFLTSWFLVILKQDKIRGYAYKERLFNYIRKNRSKISIPGLTRPRHREKPADLEAGAAEDGDAEDKHTTPNDKGKAPERNPDADMKTDESVKKGMDSGLGSWIACLRLLEKAAHRDEGTQDHPNPPGLD